MSRVELAWTGRGHAFEGRRGHGAGPTLQIESGNSEAVSPTDTLLLSLASCMAVDVLMILEKGRVEVRELTVLADGDRAENPPRRFTAIQLHFRLAGPGPGDRRKIERAIQLSREKYCSVIHTLSPDLEVEITHETAEGTERP